MQASPEFSQDAEDVTATHSHSTAQDYAKVEQETPPTYADQERTYSWYTSFKRVLPIFLATRLTFLLLTYTATLFTLGDFSTRTFRVVTLLNMWFRWDSGHFTAIATRGYDLPYRTAFFPLFPLLEALVALIIHNPFVAGLIISNCAALGMLVVLHRLVAEDFDAEQAFRTCLYLSLFPTAFFFAAAYNESLFLCLALLSFYSMRKGRWGLAGLFGFFASLTRSAGLFLVLPFLFEYLRQHDFKLQKIRFGIIGGMGIPAGVAVFALYCYVRFHDPLAFSHAESTWHLHLSLPWHGSIAALRIILTQGILNFYSIHNVIDLSAGMLMLVLTILCFTGPWKFPRYLWSYALYLLPLYIFLLLFPLDNSLPLAALSRHVLELFPAFIILAAPGRYRSLNLYYLTLSAAMLAVMLLLFLTGHWII